MRCHLCLKEIEKYHAAFNRLVIDEGRTVEVCQACIDKFFRWQGRVYSTLFPTKAMKKRFGISPTLEN